MNYLEWHGKNVNTPCTLPLVNCDLGNPDSEILDVSLDIRVLDQYFYPISHFCNLENMLYLKSSQLSLSRSAVLLSELSNAAIYPALYRSAICKNCECDFLESPLIIFPSYGIVTEYFPTTTSINSSHRHSITVLQIPLAKGNYRRICSSKYLPWVHLELWWIGSFP